jgi:hypothetical protein
MPPPLSSPFKNLHFSTKTTTTARGVALICSIVMQDGCAPVATTPGPIVYNKYGVEWAQS